MRSLVAILIALLLPACAARTALEPLGEGRTAVSASVGGPLVSAFDTYVPIPNLSVGVNHGLGATLDAGGTLYLLPFAFGNLGLDLGATWYPVVDTAAATIAVQPRLMMFASFREDVDERFRVWPVVSGSAAWRIGDDRIYTGLDLLANVAPFDYDEEPPPVIISPFVGYRWALGARTRLLTELKWHGVNVRTDATVEYVNPFGMGGIAPFIGFEMEM